MSECLTVGGGATLVEVSAPAATIAVADGAALVEVAVGTAVVEVGGTATLIEVSTPGPQGPPGDGDKTYVHDQATAATVWTVNHGLNKYPSIDVIDSGGNLVYGDVRHVSAVQATITFNYPFGGKAFAN